MRSLFLLMLMAAPLSSVAQFKNLSVHASVNTPSIGSVYEVEKVSDKEPFNKIAVSGIIETSYRLFSKVSLSISAQKFFTSVYQDDYQYGGSTKMNLFSFGVSYQIK